MNTTPAPVSTQYLDRPGGRIAFDDTGGAGPLVIAAPGMGDTRGSYRHIRRPLADAGLRVVTMDLRGQGDSDATFEEYTDEAVATDYLALASHLDAGPAVLVGNSLSCASAVIAATDAPQQVAGIALLGPFVRPVEMAWWQKWLFALMLGGPWGRTAWVGYYRKSLFPGPTPPDHDEHVASVSAMLSKKGHMSAFRALAAESHEESGNRLPSVGVPATVIMGTADPDFPDAAVEARQIADVLGAHLVMAEGSGHYPQADQPSTTVPAIVNLAMAPR